MNTKSFKVVFALSFSILCGILIGKNLAYFTGIPLGWLLGCVTTLITGLFFYEPAEILKYLGEALIATSDWIESKKRPGKPPRLLLRKKRVRRARRLALMTNAPYTISTLFDRILLWSSWFLLTSFLLDLHGEFLSLMFIVILGMSFGYSVDTLFKICTMKPNYRFLSTFFSKRIIVNSFSKKLGEERGWHFVTITRSHNPVSVLIKLICFIYEHRMEIILGTGIFLLEMMKKLNSHERIVIAVFGVTFCLVGLIVDSLSPNRFVGPLTGLIGGTIVGMIEQILYNYASPKIDGWIEDMEASLSLVRVTMEE